MEFHTLLKKLRLRAGYGLRQFAELVGEHPSNYAGVESAQRAPWRTIEKLRKIADALTLEEGTRDWQLFFDTARVAGSVPLDMANLLERPAVLQLLRTVNDRRLSDDDLRKVAEYIHKGRYKRSQRHDS